MSSCLRSSRSILCRYKGAQPPLTRSYQRAPAPLLPAACPWSRPPAHLTLGWQNKLRKVVATGLLAYSMVLLRGGSGPELRRRRWRQQERNPSKEGKGNGARELTRDQSPEEDLVGDVPISALSSRRRLLSPPPVAASPPYLVCSFRDRKHGVNLVGDKTGGCSVPGREHLGWAGKFPK
jgi:hypothetical protein